MQLEHFQVPGQRNQPKPCFTEHLSGRRIRRGPQRTQAIALGTEADHGQGDQVKVPWGRTMTT